jgi:hypothetical protein
LLLLPLWDNENGQVKPGLVKPVCNVFDLIGKEFDFGSSSLRFGSVKKVDIAHLIVGTSLL